MSESDSEAEEGRTSQQRMEVTENKTAGSRGVAKPLEAAPAAKAGGKKGKSTIKTNPNSIAEDAR